MGMLFMVCFNLFTMGCKRIGGDEKTKCVFCGDGEDSFRSVYGGRAGVGLFCLSDLRMIQIHPRADEEVEGDVTSHVWADAYSVQVDRMTDRGISLVQYGSDGGDVLDLDMLSESLCPACIEDIKGSVKIYGREKGQKEKAVCLVDLSTMELCGIQQSFQYYMFDDHYVQADRQGDKIRLTVFQTSEDLDRL